MSDDSFIREVNEELRQDKARAFWDRYGKILIGVVVLAVSVTAAIVFWRDYQEKQAAASGDRFLAAIEKADEGDRDAALVELETLQADGTGDYGELARFKRAALLADEGSTSEAVELFDQIAADGEAPQTLRDFASLRAGYLLVDQNDYEAVAQRVQPLASETNALRFSAREALGLAAWKTGRNDEAKEHFEALVSDIGAPANLRRRATLMSDLLAAGASAEGGPAETGSSEQKAEEETAPAPSGQEEVGSDGANLPRADEDGAVSPADLSQPDTATGEEAGEQPTETNAPANDGTG